jgi:predicted nucleic acid-binding protein
MRDANPSLRVFLDSGVVIEGCLRSWGSSKGLLILLTQKDRYTVLLSELSRQDIERAVQKASTQGSDAAAQMQHTVSGWVSRIHLELLAVPAAEEVDAGMADLLPTIRHPNDLPLVVNAVQANPDWVISTNRRHWNDELANKTGLRIASPVEFLRHLTVGRTTSSEEVL